MAVKMDPKMVPPTAAPMTAPWLSEHKLLFWPAGSEYVELVLGVVVIGVVVDTCGVVVTVGQLHTDGFCVVHEVNLQCSKAKQLSQEQ